MTARHMLGLLCITVALGGYAATAQNVTLCWGNGGHGQLGNGDASLDYGEKSSIPVLVAGDLPFAAVCTGLQHSCALDSSGKAWCWGDGGYGQLGAGNYDNTNKPVRVATDTAFQSITCGDDHTCALDFEGKAWCWGSNAFGQFGDGDPLNSASNVPVGGPIGHTFTSLSAGVAHTCGLKPDGRALCFGYNEYGQLGAGASIGYSYEPLEVAGSRTFRSISAGTDFTCALDEQREAWCWGRGDSGQLGSGSLANQSVPVPVMGGRSFAAISTGNFFTCALAADGLMWFWGKPAFWSKSIYEPMKVGDGRSYAALTAASVHTCGLDNSGKLWCFGDNMHGERGSGTPPIMLTDVSLTPEKVVGGYSFVSIGEALEWHTCAIATKQADPGSSSSSSSSTPSGSASGLWNPSTTLPAIGSYSSSSSTPIPIGAIVGCIAAAAALSVTACLLRTGRCRLRRGTSPPVALENDGAESALPTPAAVGGASQEPPTPAAMEEGSPDKELSTPASSKAGSASALDAQPGRDTTPAPLPAPSLPAVVGPLQAAWTSSSMGSDSLARFSHV